MTDSVLAPLLRVILIWRRQAPAIVFGALVALASLAAGIALMAAAGHYIAAAALGITLAVPVALEVTGVARVVLRYLERLTTHDATFRALAALRLWFYRGLARSAAGGLGFRRSGDVLARLVNDIEALDGVLLRLLIPLLGAAMLVPVLLVAVGRDDDTAAALVLVLFAVVAFVMPWRAMLAARAAAADETEAGGALRVSVLDTLTGLREIKVYEAEGRMLAGVQWQESRLFRAERDLAARGGALQGLAFLATQAALLAVLLIHGANPVAVVVAVFVVVAAFEVVGGMPRAGVTAGRASAAASRVLQAAEAEPRVRDPARPAPMPGSNALAFEHVAFRWTPEGQAVFEDLSLDIPAGSRIAVLGPSGAGKSTLAALALKLVSPDEGQIRLGGTDIATLRSADVRRRIAWLSQTTHLFADTIRNNLLIGRDDADDDALWAALEAARIADMVRALPDGLEAWVGEQGSQFSGGQGRRLALARTLLSPAPILILDEPCSGLDLETERAFLATLNNTLEGRTVLMITHRLTGVERLDRVYRLQNGRLTPAAR
ncbi:MULTISPECIES: thiol reductant ABC exporter subunit CydC [Acidiphilium]|jgi:ATP-binding cassette subfamily C protein CydC|uniref:ABC transporter permease/ATP-binding protein n=1 Tax=Acidiphilium multivorum (strain DSM 11245 / JCM 8867 / NBRC 100883 / AIU 301) TaxID=926570 RepID=F0J4C2_ACIMA|nr:MULTISPECIES: thiol reductant ABC exporter subunit CydC [Acidiphilium]MBS3024727.1 thiol reductant ABC exporter subunit CydC [Acidiphilium multivorum]BAJ79974.1 ABC transporter permease/ATP-binding protein [Acidiphilium multivorum AIU301]GAN74186.1 ABC transporter cysteine exporter CydCD [Acidiphilium multivorum AIU301]